MKTFTTLLAYLLLGYWAIASEEEFAIWSSVEITSNIERAGAVTVTGQADKGSIVALQIVAFGRTNALSGEDIKKIASFPLADMKITHEAGYERLGGYSVNVRLRRIAYDADKNLQDETAIITVTEKQGLQPVMIRKTWAGEETDKNLTKQISDILAECRKIAPGATRAELLKVFTTEGGISTARQRTLIHRRCPYIKVDVEFTLSDSKRSVVDERPTDTVSKISRPYLDWSIVD